MKTHHKKKKTHSVGMTKPKLPIGMHKTKEIDSKDAHWPDKGGHTYSPMETGQVDRDKSSSGAPLGRGPMNEEGQGDRQNDELAELEQIEPRL